MKEWTVKTGRTAKTTHVTCVQAEYVVVEHGHLIFRNSQKGYYPSVVQAFAPGAWTEVAYNGQTQ